MKYEISRVRHVVENSRKMINDAGMTSVINRFALERIGNENTRKIAFFSNSEKKKRRKRREKMDNRESAIVEIRAESFEDRLERRRDSEKAP